MTKNEIITKTSDQNLNLAESQRSTDLPSAIFTEEGKTDHSINEHQNRKISKERDSFKKMNPRDLNRLIQSLPALIKDPVEIFSFSSERLIMTFGAITAAGGLLPKVSGKYKDRKVHPALFLAIIAPPASNKGVIGYIRTLVLKVHKQYKLESDIAKSQYKADLNKHKLAGKSGTLSTEPSHPLYQSPLIAGDITGAKLVQQLNDNAGIPSLMIEDEVDSVAKSISGEHGQQLSKHFRSIFEHGTISQQLKGGNQHYEIERPFMAMILAGTLNQLGRLIGNIENGLMSRFMLISVNDGPVWQSVAPCKGCINRDEAMDQFSDRFFEFWKFFRTLDLEIDLTTEQWNTLDEFGAEELSIQYNFHHEQMSGTVKRTLNMTFRLCQILTAIRQWEKGSTDNFAICYQNDFDLAIQLTGHFYRCSIEFFNVLPGGGTSKSAGTKEALLKALPEQFTRAEAQLIATSHKIGSRTADRILKDLTEGKLLLKPAPGQYEKVSMAKMANLQSDEDSDW